MTSKCSEKLKFESKNMPKSFRGVAWTTWFLWKIKTRRFLFHKKKKDFLGLLLLLLFGPTSSTFPSDQGLSAFSTESAIYEFLLRSYWNYLLKYEHSVLQGKGKFRPQKALDEISKDKSFT